MKPFFAMFPGQGSQKVGMLKELVSQFSYAKERLDSVDAVLGFSLSAIMFDGPAERLTATEITQPAILTSSAIAFEVATKELGLPAPVAAAGHSLGEFSALVAAGSITLTDAVRLVHLRGKFMQEAVPAGTGKMVAVLGKEVAEIEAVLAKVTAGSCEIANINAPGQVVVSGSKSGVEEFVALFAGAKVVELQVSAPFHCSLMRPAAEKLAGELIKVAIQPPKFPVIANVTAQPHTDPTSIRELLVQQVTGRVRWTDCVATAQQYKPEIAIEFGTGNVLQGLLKRTAPELAKIGVGTPAEVESAKASL